MYSARLELLPSGVLDLALSKLTAKGLARASPRPFEKACSSLSRRSRGAWA